MISSQVLRGFGHHPQRFIYAQGRIEGATDEISLRPQLHGRVIERFVRQCEQVKAGQLLPRIDDRQYRREFALAAAELSEAKAFLERLQNGARHQERREAQSQYHAKVAEPCPIGRVWPLNMRTV